MDDLYHISGMVSHRKEYEISFHRNRRKHQNFSELVDVMVCAYRILLLNSHISPRNQLQCHHVSMLVRNREEGRNARTERLPNSRLGQ